MLPIISSYNMSSLAETTNVAEEIYRFSSGRIYFHQDRCKRPFGGTNNMYANSSVIIVRQVLVIWKIRD